MSERPEDCAEDHVHAEIDTDESRVPARAVARRAAPVGAAVLAALALLAAPSALDAQNGHGDGDDGDHAHEGLHFAHPMIAESVTPDTKIRLDHQFFDFPDGDTESSGVLEAEYALTPGFSIEAGIPYSYTATAFGNAEVLVKFANRAFEDAGLLLGYGIELGLPTNGSPEAAGPDDPGTSHGHGSVAAARADFPVRFSGGGSGVGGTLGTDEWEVGPFLNVGWKSGPVELLAWGQFGIPFGQESQEEVATEISWNFSALFHASSRLQPMLELDGSGGISGEAVGEDVAQISPGLKARPFPDEPVWIGTSVGFPLATGVEEDPFDVRWKTSLFWHF